VRVTGSRPAISSSQATGPEEEMVMRLVACYPLGMDTYIYRISELYGLNMQMIFYLRVTPKPDLNRDGYRADIFSHLRLTRRVSDTLLLL
jgi:hypothetical protein